MSIKNQSFEISFEYIKNGDLVYLDPPYLPFTDDEYVFTDYNESGFEIDEQLNLADMAANIVSKGSLVIASNNYTKQVKKIYNDAAKKYNLPAPIIKKVPIKRTMNRKGKKRVTVHEALIFLTS